MHRTGARDTGIPLAWTSDDAATAGPTLTPHGVPLQRGLATMTSARMRSASSPGQKGPDWPPQRTADPLLHISRGLPPGVGACLFSLDGLEPVDLA